MDPRLTALAARAADQHAVFGMVDLLEEGVTRALRASWARAGLIERVGPHSFRFTTSPLTWEGELVAGLLDLGACAAAAGRSAAALHRLDGFPRRPVELLVPRQHRNRATKGIHASTRRPLLATDICRIDGIRCLRAERLILEAPLFGFSTSEIENAVDSAIRLRLTTEQRLRDRVAAERVITVNGSRGPVDALVDAGGESRLERRFLALIRKAGLPRPQLQVTFRSGSRVVARVDAFFDGNLVVEVEGHATHSSRRQRQADEQRRSELTVVGKRVVTFTYDDVMKRPGWVAAQITELRSRECHPIRALS